MRLKRILTFALLLALVITALPLTAGKEIGHVTDIWLSAFICTSLEDFDEDRNYIGNTACTIHILKK